jgi:PPOX class probable F420-dependent enzyme
MSVLWFKWTGEKFQISTIDGRQKQKNLRNNPQASLMFIDPDNMYRYLEVRGKVEITDVGEQAAIDLADWLAKAYTGKDSFYGDDEARKASETRLIINILPEHVVARG